MRSYPRFLLVARRTEAPRCSDSSAAIIDALMADEAARSSATRSARLRVGVKALVISNGAVLCVRKRDDEGDICSFPGVGQDPGETLAEAVRRELREETGLDALVGELLFVREYIGRNHEHAGTDARVHVTDHIFRGHLIDDSEAAVTGATPHGRDPDQVGVSWVPVDELHRHRFFPRALIGRTVEIARDGRSPGPVYVGDVN